MLCLILSWRLIQIEQNTSPKIMLQTPIPIDMYASIEVSLRCSVIEANLSIQCSSVYTRLDGIIRHIALINCSHEPDKAAPHPKRAERIVGGWAEQKVIREIMLFLHSQPGR